MGGNCHVHTHRPLFVATQASACVYVYVHERQFEVQGTTTTTTTTTTAPFFLTPLPITFLFHYYTSTTHCLPCCICLLLCTSQWRRNDMRRAGRAVSRPPCLLTLQCQTLEKPMLFHSTWMAIRLLLQRTYLSRMTGRTAY